MQFISTRKRAPAVSASQAILQGLAPDGGLYVPTSFPRISLEQIADVSSYPELAYEILAPYFIGDELESQLADICKESFDFPVPLHWHTQKEATLELFWGPTAAFKDFGARFLASAIERLLAVRKQRLTILVATSGDTGGAVAAAFHGREGISVKVLFPEGLVSKRQQQQLTCWQDNIEAYAVRGTFDDCQRMVKEAFMDEALVKTLHLCSANSINLGRLLPQMVYCFSASLEAAARTGEKPLCIIPSGNVGNSCGSYWAKQMGAPVAKIVLAVNANRTICDYIESGVYKKRPSIATLANAMDVGDPSNMERLFSLFPDHKQFVDNVSAFSVDDDAIISTIAHVWRTKQYIVCPHTATGEYVRALLDATCPSVVYGTAHPAKFDTIVEPIIGTSVPIPAQLAALLDKPSSYQTIEADYHALI